MIYQFWSKFTLIIPYVMEERIKKRGLQKKRYIIPMVIVILLIAFRLYLPTLVKQKVNQVLAEIPGYYGHVDDIDISLLRGAYVIKGMFLNKGTATSNVPFLEFPKSDISIEWKSLFHGKIVSEIFMENPEFNYVFEDQKEESGDADIEDWTKALTDLVPIDINHFEVHNGKVAFIQLSADPDIDLEINNLFLTADNLRNVVDKNTALPSPINASGVSVGNGNVLLDGNINLLKQIPDMDMSFSLENADITALNDFSKYYAGLDFDKGSFSVYSEVAIADGHFVGYIKPLLTDTKLIGEGDKFLEVLWEGFVGVFKFLLKNQGTDTLATKVPIEGDLNDLKAGVWPTVLNIFKNGWIEAFKGDVDDEISFKDALQNEDLSREEKRDLRKKKRRARREKRKKEKEKKN
jgi:ABC-type multidrug transport system fused ATPase/permease subunit